MKDRGEAKRKRMQIFFGLFIIFIMVFSVFGYFIAEDTEKIEFNGHEFVQVNGNWVGYKGDSAVVLINDPRELTNVIIENIDELDHSNYQKIYFSIAPGINYRNALYSYTNNLGDYLPAAINMACYIDGAGCEDLPLKDCKDANKDVLVIKFMPSDESKVIFENNCLLIQGEDLNIPTERFVLETIFD